MMTEPLSYYLFALAIAAAFSLVLTQIVKMISLKVGFASHPDKIRWNTRVVALGGGIATNITILAAIVWLVPMSHWDLLPAIVVIFALGLIDDIIGISAILKLVIQTVVATYVVSLGYTLPIPGTIIPMLLSIIWIVGATNALNLIDNMDGLAAGCTAISALGFAYLFYESGNGFNCLLAVVIAGSALGFLFHNWHPASIFMGDVGSLSFGFLLAVSATKIEMFETSNIAGLIPALLLLVVPVFDMGLVIVARRRANRPVMSGGRDHSSHRLVSLGLSEKRAVGCLFLLTAYGCFAARFAVSASWLELLAISSFSGLLLIVAGVFLLETVVYSTPDPKTGSADMEFAPHGTNYLPIHILYVIELALDMFAISLVWTLAHLVRFTDGNVSYYDESSMIPYLPFVICSKLVAFAGFRLYRGMWKSIFANDVYTIFKAVTLGSLILVAALAFRNRLEHMSRIVLALDWVFTFVAIVGIRGAISAFRRWSRRLASHPYRVAAVATIGLKESIEKAIALKTSMQFTGLITPKGEPTCTDSSVLGEQKDLNELVDEYQIEVLYTLPEEVEPILSGLSHKGVSVRPLSVQLD